MSLSTDDVKKVASLARVAMTEPEILAAHAQLANIFGLIEEMRAVDTAGVAPMAHAQDLSQRLRKISRDMAGVKERTRASGQPSEPKSACAARPWSTTSR